MNFISLLIFTGAVNGILLCLILFSKNYKTHKANYFLGFFTLIITFNLVEHFVTMEGYIIYIPHIMATFVPLFFLLGPLYYFYVKSLIESNFQLEKKHLIHLIPAIVCFVSILPYYLLSGEIKLEQFYSFDVNKRDEYVTDYKIWYHLSMFIQAIIYIIYSIKLINQTVTLTDGRSNKKMIGVLNWLRKFSFVFISFICLYILIHTYITYVDAFIFETLKIYNLIISTFIYIVGYWSINKSELLHHVVSKNEIEKIETLQLKEIITKLFKEDELYLEPELSLYKLSRTLNVNTQYLSKYINNVFNCSFTFLVNSYRISLAKKLIEDPKYDHLNLLGIGIEVGFTTKNTFTRAFQKHTGMTPSQYKKSQRSSN